MTGSKWEKFRIFIVFIMFLLAGSGIILRAAYLQVANSNYSKFLKNKYKKQITKKIKIKAERGKILDANNNELAISNKSESIYVNPKIAKDKKKIAEVLSNVLNLDYKEILTKVNSNKSFVWIKRKVPIKTTKTIKKLKLKGVFFLEEYKRYYPYGSLASNLIGFCNIDGNGAEGIEYAYDKYLKGKSREIVIYKDATQHSTTVLSKDIFQQSSGNNVKLTINAEIQSIVENEVKLWVKNYQAARAGAIVIEPYTGRVLAMVSYPTFDPNNYTKFNKENFRNIILNYNFEPGSTVKPLIVAWALSKKLIDLDWLYYCGKGYYRFKTLNVHDHAAFKWLDVRKIIVHSSNIGMVKIVEYLGKSSVYKIYEEFGFGNKTGINTVGENRGIVQPLTKFSPVTYATMSYGQGVAVTPIQIAVAYSALINGGELLIPYVVEEVVDNNGKIIKKYRKKVRRKIIDKETSKKMKEVLVEVVEKGTGQLSNIRYIKLGGKTGTAQIPSKDGGYEKDEYLSSFVGFFPANKPKCLMFLFIEKPKKNYYSSRVVCPEFKKIAEEIMPFFDLKQIKSRVVAKFQKSKKRRYKCKGVPDLLGLTKAEVLKILNEKHIKNFRFIGSGYVAQQSIKPGEKLTKKDKLIITFKL